MNRREVEWVARPSEDDERTTSDMHFRVAEDWFAVDGEQLVLPIVVLEKDGNTFDPPVPAILKQYGGEGLLNDMLLSDQDLAVGSEWAIYAEQNRRLTVEPTAPPE